MVVMALAFAKLSPNPDHISGNKKVRYRKVTFDNSYPDNGEAVTAANFGLVSLEFVEVLGALQKADESLAYLCGYDPENKKLVAYEGDNDNAGDAPLIEADASDDLDGYYVYCKAIGW